MRCFILILGQKPLFGVKIDILGKKSVFCSFFTIVALHVCCMIWCPVKDYVLADSLMLNIM